MTRAQRPGRRAWASVCGNVARAGDRPSSIAEPASRASLVLPADAAAAEWACVRAHLFERAGQRLDVGVAQVPREVSLDSVAVVAASLFHGFGALVGRGDKD